MYSVCMYVRSMYVRSMYECMYVCIIHGDMLNLNLPAGNNICTAWRAVCKPIPLTPQHQCGVDIHTTESRLIYVADVADVGAV